MTATETKQGNGSHTIEQQAEPDGKAVLAAILEGKAATYTPLAEQTEITLTIGLVQQYLCVPTRTGKTPTKSDCTKYVMMCRQRGLNPWVGDCYLLGYDTQDGPKFSMVVAIQALLKRAELARSAQGEPAFDGMESGVVVQQDDQIVERQGDLVLDGEKLLGGWAKVYRKDRSKPFYQRLKLSTYQKGTLIWKHDPAGMIAKCASAAALREAFPSDIGGLYVSEEIEAFAQSEKKERASGQTVNLDTYVQSTEERREAAPKTVPDETSQQRDESGDGIDEPPAEPVHAEPAHTEPLDDESALNNWAFDVEQAGNLEALDKLTRDAQNECQGEMRQKVFNMIATKRTAIAGGRKDKPKNGVGQQSMPGMQG